METEAIPPCAVTTKNKKEVVNNPFTTTKGI
jgi:hypothetical protein